MGGEILVVNILGVDQSYTGFGYSNHREDAYSTTLKKAFPSSKFGGQGARLTEIYTWFTSVLNEAKPDWVFMEGYANAVKFGREMSGELGGVVKSAVWDYNATEAFIVPPTTLKKFVTGSGNAPKNVMLQQVYKRWGQEFTDDNMADAFSLGMFGKAYWGINIGYMSKAMMDVLIKFKKERAETK